MTLLRSPLFAPFALALRNMRTRLGRTLLTTAGISLGVAVVLAIQITNESTLASINRVFDRAAGQANLLVSTNSLMSGTGESLSEELTARMAAVPEVEVASPTLRVQTLLASEAESWELTVGVGGVASGTVLDVYGIQPELDPQVRVYLFTEGRMPEPDTYEAAIPAEFAEEKGLAMGDDLVILIPDGTARLEIVGLLESEGVGLLNSGAVAFAPLSVAQDLFSRNGEVDEIALRIVPQVADDANALDALKAELETRAGRNARVIYPAARGQLVARMLGSYQQGLQFFSLIAIFVGSFLIYNTFTMTVVERTHEIGMMRAIGMSRRQVMGLVMAEAGLLGVLGSLVGLVLGVALARGLILALTGFLASGESVLSVPPQGVAQSFVMGIVVTLVASLIPAVQASRISPLEALRVRARTGEAVRPVLWASGLALLFVGLAAIYGLEFRPSVAFNALTTSVMFIFLGATLTVPLAVTLLQSITRQLSGRVYGREGEIGSANVQRSLGRTTLTVSAMIVSLAMIVGIGSMSYSFEKDFSSWIDASLGGDLYVTSPVRMREAFGRQLESVPGVEAVSPSRILIAQIARRSLPPNRAEDNDTVYFIAIDPQSYRQVSAMEFVSGQGEPQENWALFEQGNAVFISSVLAESLKLDKGDTIYLQTRRGERPFVVAGVIVDFFAQGQTITASYSDLHEWWGENGADRFILKVQDGYSTDAVAQDLKDRYQKTRNISVQTTASFKAQISQLLEQSLALFDVLSMISVVIGTLGVINTLTMNVLERTREIGGLRSLGMTRGQIIRMILAEALGLGGMGAIYGLTFGYVLAQIMIESLNQGNGYDLEFIFTLQPFLLGALLALGISQLAALSPARRGAALNIVEAIKHE